jgi:hypothetical protein
MGYWLSRSFKVSMVMAGCPVGEDKSFFSGMKGFMGYKFTILRSACFSREGCTIVLEITRISSIPASEYLIGDIVLFQEGIQARTRQPGNSAGCLDVSFCLAHQFPEILMLYLIDGLIPHVLERREGVA